MTAADANDHSWLVNAPTTVDEVRRHYDDWVDTYDETLAGWEYGAPRRVAASIRDAVPAHGAILDAGCGTGLVGVALRDLGHTGPVTGVDLSPKSVARALASGAYAATHVADLHDPLPFSDATFDAVTCVGVLTYVPDVRSIWQEFCRVVRAGGTIALTQRADVWAERDCTRVLHELERERRWVVTELTPPAAYLPGNPDFSDQINVRYLVART